LICTLSSVLMVARVWGKDKERFTWFCKTCEAACSLRQLDS
jgi:hypothetical protein